MFSRILGVTLLALALPLAACKNPITAVASTYDLVVGATVSQGKVSALHSGIQVTERTTNAYLETCITPANAGITGCDKPTVGKVAKALRAVRAADDDLVAALQVAQKSGSSVGVASTVYNVAVDAANALTAAKPAAS